MVDEIKKKMFTTNVYKVYIFTYIYKYIYIPNLLMINYTRSLSIPEIFVLV